MAFCDFSLGSRPLGPAILQSRQPKGNETMTPLSLPKVSAQTLVKKGQNLYR